MVGDSWLGGQMVEWVSGWVERWMVWIRWVDRLDRWVGGYVCIDVYMDEWSMWQMRR